MFCFNKKTMIIFIYNNIHNRGGKTMGLEGLAEIFEFMVEAMFGLIIVLLVVALVLYVLGAIGLSGIAKQTKTKSSWMAWVPVVNIYLIGKIAFNKGIGWVLIILCFLSGSSETTINDEVVQSGSILPAPFNTIASLALALIGIATLYRMYRKVSNRATLMTVLSILSCGILAPIFLFAIRNNPARV